MIESLLLAAVGCAVVGGVYGAVQSTRTPSNDTTWRKQPPQIGKTTSVHNTVDHLGRKEPTL